MENINAKDTYQAGKGISTKYTSHCLSKAGDDEPIFVLRAKDRTAPAAIGQWVLINQGIQPEEKLNGALALAEEMRAWRENNIR
jgi:hypothetical protein